MNAAAAPRLRTSRWFLAGQAVILLSLVALPVARAVSIVVPPAVPPTQNNPLKVAVPYNWPQVVTDEQLHAVLTKLRPRLARPRPVISVVDHALRFWGPNATFADPQCLSGQQMLHMLLNHEAYVQAWGKDAAPLLYLGEHGISVRTQEGGNTASHVDHTLATLAEIGLPLDAPVFTAEGTGTVADILRQAVRDFSLNQAEYEWTAIALALYAPVREPWLSREGQAIDFNLLARRIMRQGYRDGVCMGQHRLYSLAVLLQVDQTHNILEPQTALEIEKHLLEATTRLVATQSVDGWWDSNWVDGGPVSAEEKLSERSRRLLATGHVLEWWAIAPESVLPPRETVIRAGQWLARQVQSLDDKAIDDNYTYLTHVGRALALWRGMEPAAHPSAHAGQ